MPTDVVVVGGAVVDAIHRAESQRGASLYGTSTPCRMHSSHGGVGRNIAEALSRLGVSVQLISVVGDELTRIGSALREYCASLHINVDFVKEVPNAATASYTAILDADGELTAASAAMQIFEEHLTPVFVLQYLPSILKARWVVIDGNVPRQTVNALVAAIAAHRQANQTDEPRIAVDPISRIKVRHFVDALEHIDVFKPNHHELIELAALLQDTIEKTPAPVLPPDLDPEVAQVRVTLYCKLLCLRLVERYPRMTVLCTLGKSGSVVGRRFGASPPWTEGTATSATPSQYGSLCRHQLTAEVRYFSAEPIPTSSIKKVTGAGDSFLSGFLFSELLRSRQEPKGVVWSVEGQLTVARNAARMTLQSTSTIARELSREALLKGISPRQSKL